MPSYLFNDTLQSYAVGNGTPSGFWQVGTVFTSAFQQFASPGLAGNTGIVYALFGTIAFPTNNLTPGTLVTQTSVFWSALGNGVNTGTTQLAYVGPGPTFNTAIPVQVIFEADGSISVLVAGVNKFNSLTAVVQQNVWMYCQLEVLIGSIAIGPNTFLTFDVQLGVNGKLLIDTGGPAISSIVVNGAVGVGINQWQYLVGNGYLGEIVATSDIQTIPFFPNPGSPMHARISQIAVEAIKMNQFRQGRVSQVAVELATQPTTRNARISQIIVELIMKGGSIKSGGFHVIES